VLIGILSAQWLREYQRDVALGPKAKLALRQMRYEGLIYWQVPRIIALLPLLLQFGFILFLLGLVELLWVLNKTVAIPVTVFIGSIFLFLVATIILPTTQYMFVRHKFLHVPQCPYKSPQSLAFLRFILALLWAIPPRVKGCFRPGSSVSRLLSLSHRWTWLEFDLRWHAIHDAGSISWRTPLESDTSDQITKALKWVTLNFNQTEENIISTLQCIHDLPFPAALNIIRNVSPHVLPRRHPDFAVLLRAREDIPDDVWQDIVTVAYLGEYQQKFPLLQAYYWECQIRLMNYRFVSRDLVEWSGVSVPVQDLPSSELSSNVHPPHQFTRADRRSTSTPSSHQGCHQMRQCV